MKFKKKPVIINAIQFTGESQNISEVLEFANNVNIIAFTDIENPVIVISTLEGDMVANPGDWIIKGVAGEFYPCKPAIFEQTYELMGDEPVVESNFVTDNGEIVTE